MFITVEFETVSCLESAIQYLQSRGDNVFARNDNLVC